MEFKSWCSGVLRKRYRVVLICITALFLFNINIALGTSDAGHGETHPVSHGEDQTIPAESHGEGHGNAHAAASPGWVKTDWLRVMNFAVLAAGLIYLIRRFRLVDMVNARINDIKEQLDDLESKKQAAEKQLSVYKEKITQLDQEAEKIIADYIKQGEEAKERILQEAKAAAVKLEDQAQRTIEQEFKNAKMQLQADIIEKALVKAEEIVKNKITSEDQVRLVDEYLEKVVAQ